MHTVLLGLNDVEIQLIHYSGGDVDGIMKLLDKGMELSIRKVMTIWHNFRY